MNEKDARLARLCRERGYDGAILRRRSNIAWLTDGVDVHCDMSSRLGVATVFWTPRKKVVLTDCIEAARMAEEEFGSEWEIRESPWWEPQRFPRGRYLKDFPRDTLTDLRLELTDSELKRFRALAAESAEVVGNEAKRVNVGQTEHKIAGQISGMLRGRGILPYVVLVAADRRIDKFRHPIPTGNRLRKKLMMVLCAQRHGLIVSLTRMVHFGPLPRDLRRKHDAVCVVDEALHRATVPGRRWRDVLAAGVRAYEEVGFADEWTKHHQGGPAGYECRDFKATPKENRKVLKNQAVAWNPSITGTKSEDTILAGGEVLTSIRSWPSCGSRPDILVRRSTPPRRR